VAGELLEPGTMQMCQSMAAIDREGQERGNRKPKSRRGEEASGPAVSASERSGMKHAWHVPQGGFSSGSLRF